MDPRHTKKYRDARREEKKIRRADLVRRENQGEIDSIDGAFVAEALGAIPDLDLYTISVLRDYLGAGLRMSVRVRDLYGKMVDGEILEPGEEREAVLDMLEGAVGLLNPSGKRFAYHLLERREDFLAFLRGLEWPKVQDLLDQALGRGFYAIKV